MRFLIRLFIFFVFLLATSLLFSQSDTYILNGTATRDNCHCYTLTPATINQSGSVWNKNKIDLRRPFDFWFNVNLGCLDSLGADGIVFMLQPISTSLGALGGGLGFAGVQPSIGISLDTYQNLIYNDPEYDHISIQANGSIIHGNDLAGPVQASATSNNIEDCQWHILRISWNPATQSLQAYFDSILRVTTKVDLISTIFFNDPMVYWGFSAATGGRVNEQRFCTALNPDFTTNLPDNTTCFETAVPILFQDQSISFTAVKGYWWSFGDGATSTRQNPPAHLYTKPGIYDARLVITAQDGCSDTMTKKINIGDKPIAQFQIRDTCFSKAPYIREASSVRIGTIKEWEWQVDGIPASNQQKPVLTNLTPGQHKLTLKVKSNFGCESDPVFKSLIINPSPKVTFEVKDGCANEVMLYDAVQTDQQTQIQQWHWILNNETKSQQQNTQYSFKQGGTKQVQLVAQASNGCSSDTITKSFFINQLLVSAGKDTLVAKEIPFTLTARAAQLGSDTLSYNWIPSSTLSDAASSIPTAVLSDDQLYILTVTSEEGCIVKDSVFVEVFKGSAVYVPNAFTPNGDGLNDVLKPRLIGISQLVEFAVYNRWGEKVFTTSERGKGWNGTQKGKQSSNETFIWTVKAIDFLGKKYEMKGTAIVIK